MPIRIDKTSPVPPSQPAAEKPRKLDDSYTDTRFVKSSNSNSVGQMPHPPEHLNREEQIRLVKSAQSERSFERVHADWRKTGASRTDHEHMLKQIVTEAAQRQRQAPPEAVFQKDLRNPAAEQRLLNMITHAMTGEDQVDRYVDILKDLSSLGLYLPPPRRSVI